MTGEILLVFGILLATIIMFAIEVFPVDKVALLLIVALSLSGLVSPEEAISGFSNTATITILALMILALGMEDTGVIATLARFLTKLHALPLLLLVPAFMFITAGISAFISTTAVVIVFIKIIGELSKRFDIPRAKLLMPISFAGIMGGSCTLMGTSTNLLVNSTAQKLGAERFSFFEFSLYGLVFLVVAVILVTIASRWLPKDSPPSLEEEYKLEDYVTTVRILEDSELIDKKIQDTFLFGNKNITLLKLFRNSVVTNAPGKYVKLQENDKLILMCDFENLVRLRQAEHLSVHEKQQLHDTPDEHAEAVSEVPEAEVPVEFVELLILPGSDLIGKNLRDLRSENIGDATPIGVQKRRNIRNTKERLIRKDFEKINLKPGDRLLVNVPQNELHGLYQMKNIAVLRAMKATESPSGTKRYLGFGILLTVIALAASGLLSILVSALLGVCLLLLTKCISLNNVYHRVNWQVIFLLAGMIPLGVAINNTGADIWISEQLMVIMSGQSNMFIIGLIFLVTMLMSGIISNNATAIIMTPIAIAVASGLELTLMPFLLAVLFGANFSFFTPMGYQTNTLIYGMGIYKFKHFLWIGGILSIVLWAIGTLLLSTLL
ncbi:SLC13 family permease [Altibacter sp. HG106]|uniref:SLC13 family permease n=1 Tax=Altibacter sp. HG106 TaxID=3023937 RepID=UPI0023500D9A|nr:SLC13 family permease [Altibacter sp. HG106]MDC7993562.1 SLC13 family permease [Altibacter sp. HG106]